MSRSAGRSGRATLVDTPRSPPKPPSPRAKIDDRTVQSFSPASETAWPSCQITADLPLSQIPVTRVERVADPDDGSGPATEISCAPCTTLARSSSQPVRSSAGGSVSWNDGATIPNDGNTWSRSSSRV